MTQRRVGDPGTWILAMALTAMVAACADGPAAESQASAISVSMATADDGAVVDWPPIHLDQVQERIVNGKNEARQDYQFALENCRMTDWPINELTSAELERLGTTRVRMWISPQLEVIRDDEWKLALDGDASAGSCLFRLKHQGRYSYMDGSMGMSRELGEPTSGAGIDPDPGMSAGAEIPPRYPLDPPSGPRGGFSPLGTSQAAGHPCRAWRGDGERGPIEQCLWSGGRAFGFDDHDTGEGCSPGRTIESNLGSIILTQEPVDGDGCRIRTLAFTVGSTLDSAAYSPPEGGRP